MLMAEELLWRKTSRRMAGPWMVGTSPTRKPGQAASTEQSGARPALAVSQWMAAFPRV
jgi:hypothetical protein